MILGPFLGQTRRGWRRCCSTLPPLVTIISLEQVTSTYSKLSALTWRQAVGTYQAGSLGGFDFIASAELVETLGLGASGEPLNPFGDLEAMAQLWCLLKPGGLLFLGAGVSPRSHIVYNSRRSYGPERMRHIGAGFEHLAHLGGWDGDAVFVLKKPNSQ